MPFLKQKEMCTTIKMIISVELSFTVETLPSISPSSDCALQVELIRTFHECSKPFLFSGQLLLVV
jgi:hypothetical protein